MYLFISINSYFYTSIELSSFLGIVGSDRLQVSIAVGFDGFGSHAIGNELVSYRLCTCLGKRFIGFGLTYIIRMSGQAHLITLGSHIGSDTLEFRQGCRHDDIFSGLKKEIIDRYRSICG